MSTIEKALERTESLSGPAPEDESPERGVRVPEEPRPRGRATPGARVLPLDLDRLRAIGLLTPDAVEGSLAEDLRHVKRPLLNNAFGPSATLAENTNLVMVTSAVPGEGKTFMSISLAMSIAMEVDKTVLLVDGDFMKSTATLLFNEQTDIGLLDVIGDPRLDLADAIVRTDVPRLAFLPSGRRRGKATELLASNAMSQIVHELASRYNDRIVIFDSPPLLAASEASVLAGLMGQVVMVVEAEKTTQKNFKEALAGLDRDKPIGLVLNKSRTKPRAGSYYGYYGY